MVFYLLHLRLERYTFRLFNGDKLLQAIAVSQLSEMRYRAL